MATKKGLTQEGEGRYLTKNKHHLREWLYKPDHHLQEHAKNEQTPSSKEKNENKHHHVDEYAKNKYHLQDHTKNKHHLQEDRYQE